MRYGKSQRIKISSSFNKPPDDSFLKNFNLDAGWQHVVQSNETKRMATIRHHQREMALEFTRKIQQFAAGYGDPLIIVGKWRLWWPWKRANFPQNLARYSEGVFYCASSGRV